MNFDCDAVSDGKIELNILWNDTACNVQDVMQKFLSGIQVAVANPSL